MRYLAILFLAGGLAALSAPAHAQDQPIPDTIVTGTRIPTPLERVPAAITIITRQDIEERGYQHAGRGAGLGARLAAGPRAGPASTSAFLAARQRQRPGADGRRAAERPVGGQRRLQFRQRPAVRRGADRGGARPDLLALRFGGDRRRHQPGHPAGAAGPRLPALWRIGRRHPADPARRARRRRHGRRLRLPVVRAIASRPRASTPRRRASRRTSGERDGFRGAFSTARLGWTPKEGTRFEGLLRWRQTNFGLDNIPRDDPNYRVKDRR